jgi:predicted RNA-binding protein
MLTVFFFPGHGDENVRDRYTDAKAWSLLWGDSILFLPGDRIHMKDIVKTRKMENGVAVYYMEGNEIKQESFNYSELIDLKINALDLLEDPKAYRVDLEKHRVAMKK